MQTQVNTYPLAVSCKSALQASRIGEVKNNRVIIGIDTSGKYVKYLSRCLKCHAEVFVQYKQFSMYCCIRCQPGRKPRSTAAGAHYAPDYTAGLNARERSRFQMYRSVGFSEREALSSVLARRGA